MTETSDDTAALERPSRAVPFNGQTITVCPLELRQTPPFTRLIRYAAPALMRVYGARDAQDGSFEDAFLELIADHGEEIIAAMATACDQDAALIERGTVEDMIPLILAIVEINGDFFAKRVAPMLAQMRGKVDAAVGALQAAESAGTGSTPSPT